MVERRRGLPASVVATVTTCDVASKAGDFSVPDDRAERSTPARGRSRFPCHEPSDHRAIIPRYSCWRGSLDNGEPRCIAFGGLRVDDAVEEALLRVVEPGAIAAAVEAEAQAASRGLGFSSFVATGNEVDIDVAESVAWLAGDAHTRTILVTIEGARDGRRLIDALEMARAAGKSVVVMKVGTTEAGAEAASSHTGSLAGSDVLYDAVFRRAGVHRAHSIEELVDIAYACSMSRLPRGKRVGIITTSGGVGVLLADAAVEHGLDLPAMSQDIQQRVRDLVPFASGRNPIDTSAQILGDLGLFARMLDIAIEGSKLDSIICFLAHVGRNADHMAQLLPHLVALRQKYPEQTFVLSLLCDGALTAQLEEAGFLVFQEPSRAVRALAAATTFGAPSAIRDMPAAAASIQQMPQVFSTGLSEHDAKAVLSGIGNPIAEDRIATTAEEARQAARAIGFPVVLKILSADIPHKSDIGGVLLGLRSDVDVHTGFDLLLTRAAAAAPGARVDGVLVSPMISGIAETILGVRRDPAFGPVVMFGLGGIFVEVFKDVTFRLAPFGRAEAHEMIREIKAFKLLDGARGRPKASTHLQTPWCGCRRLPMQTATRWRRSTSIRLSPCRREAVRSAR